MAVHEDAEHHRFPALRPADHLPEQQHGRAERQRADDAQRCEAIGRAGLPWIEELACRLDRPVRVLTHCNAGWAATCGAGTALSPLYLAHAAGIALEVFVSETRPRNQGAALTAWELGAHGVPHTVVSDNAGGHLMQHGQVDIVIVGTDRVTRNGDVANKIGTYLKALAAKDNGVPFWVALPHSTYDPRVADGVREIPIEERDGREVTHMTGRLPDGGFARNDVAFIDPTGTDHDRLGQALKKAIYNFMHGIGVDSL